MKRIATIMLALASLAVFSATAFAQDPVEYKVTVKGDVVKGSPGDHFLTFKGPVAIPDATLPAGTYIFTVVGSSAVRVSNADRTPLAMFFTSPILRVDPSDSYEVTLVPTESGATRRIAKWFLPNQSKGFEFLYEEASGAR